MIGLQSSEVRSALSADGHWRILITDEDACGGMPQAVREEEETRSSSSHPADVDKNYLPPSGVPRGCGVPPGQASPCIHGPGIKPGGP